jgi:thiol:disulfide interchange protein DsbC
MAIAVSLFSVTGIGHADMSEVEVAGNVPADVVEAIVTKFPRTDVRAIRASGLPGIYEITAGQQIVYSNADGSRIIVGNIFDTASQTNLTQVRIDEVKSLYKRLSLNDIPFEAGISDHTGAGKKMVVFTDPDCSYCRKLAAELNNVSDIEVISLLYPRPPRTPETLAKSLQIWCSVNRSAALSEALEGKDITNKDVDCDRTAFDRAIAFADKRGFLGTPMLVREDGAIVEGYRSVKELKVWLNAQLVKGERLDARR